MLDSKQLSWSHQRMHSKLGLSRDAATYPLLEVFQTQHLQLLKRKVEKKEQKNVSPENLKRKVKKKKKK
jgi:malate synthase